MADASKAHAHECPACRGIGYTPETATRYTVKPETGKYKTLSLGMGCQRCGGTGRLDALKAAERADAPQLR